MMKSFLTDIQRLHGNDDSGDEDEDVIDDGGGTVAVLMKL